jgi:molybdopterin molybdotransferase
MIFGLPGHPLSCAIIYKIIVKYYIDRLININEIHYPTLCKFSINYHKAKGREEYLPVSLAWQDGGIIAEPVFGKSGLITSFSKAWGYIRIDKNVEGIRAGQIVYAYRF